MSSTAQLLDASRRLEERAHAYHRAGRTERAIRAYRAADALIVRRVLRNLERAR